MADNLTTQSATPATVPSSSVIATDDVSGVHFQRVKLVDGTADSSVAIAGDATNGLDVDVTRVQGTVTVADGGGTLSVDDGGGSLTVDGTVAVSGSVAVTGPLTDAQLRATAVPVSGTFYQATQPVSGTVGVSGTVTVDGSGVTQPVSAGSLPLPTGAATSAKQPTIGTAGTPSADVISVQGVTGGTDLNVNTELPAAAALADGASNPTTPTAGAGNLVYNGTTWDRLRGDTTNGAWVQVKSMPTVNVNSHDVTNTGTFAVQATPRTTNLVSKTGSATGTADVSVMTAAGAGVKNYVTAISVANTGSVSTLVSIKDGSSTVIWQTIAPALGGSNITFPTPLASTANTAINFACSSASTTVYFAVTGFTGA